MENAGLLELNYSEKRPTQVVNDLTSYAVETSLLADVVSKKAITKTGQTIVNHSIRHPSNSLADIKSKQEALSEIRYNPKLREGIESFLGKVKDVEDDASSFLHHAWAKKYEEQAVVRELLVSLPRWAGEIPQPDSQYSIKLREEILSLQGTPVQKLARGPIFRTLGRKEVRGLGELINNPEVVSPLPFHTFPLKGAYSAIGGMIFPLAFYAYAFLNSGKPLSELTGFKLNIEDRVAFMMGAPLFMGLGVTIANVIGRMRDESSFFGPMRKRFNQIQPVYEAIGRLDELIAFDNFGRDLPHASIPELNESDEHRFHAKNLINAVQCQKIPNYVPNTVCFGTNGQRLAFLTGPNSGGKTSLGKSVVHAQILAQAGCYVPADEMRAALADRMHYQVGRNDSLESEEGGLGTQFEQTRDILFTSSPRSLVVIDDLIEGTTFEEKTRHTKSQLSGFCRKKPNTIYVSHHFELAQEFAQRGIGQFIQVEFKGAKPTHRIIQGISTNSHSDIVAKRVGFDDEAITRHLRETGYLGADEKLSVL